MFSDSMGSHYQCNIRGLPVAINSLTAIADTLDVDQGTVSRAMRSHKNEEMHDDTEKQPSEEPDPDAKECRRRTSLMQWFKFRY